MHGSVGVMIVIIKFILCAAVVAEKVQQEHYN